MFLKFTANSVQNLVLSMREHLISILALRLWNNLSSSRQNITLANQSSLLRKSLVLTDANVYYLLALINRRLQSED